jgi:hypothetical protein
MNLCAACQRDYALAGPLCVSCQRSRQRLGEEPLGDPRRSLEPGNRTGRRGREDDDDRVVVRRTDARQLTRAEVEARRRALQAGRREW